MTYEPAFTPSDRFTRLHGTELTVDQADSILAGILVNHDTVPEIVSLTATLVVENRRTLTYVESAEVAVTFGCSRFDFEGWALRPGYRACGCDGEYGHRPCCSLESEASIAARSGVVDRVPAID